MVEDVIQLGEDTNDSDFAMEFIMNISAKGIDRLADDPGSLNSWKALFNLTPRSWLTRSWVVQGVAFARHAVLRCGSALVSWARFCEAA